MSKTVDFIFDFGSPNAYLAWKALPAIAARHGASVKLIPCLLGGIFKATGNQAPGVAFSGVKGKLDYEMLEMRRFIAAHGLTAFRFNPHFPVNTLLLMRGQIAAQRAGVGGPYLEAMLKGMWEDGLKLDDPEVFVAAADAAGLDGAALLAATGDAEVKAELVANTEAAVARGVFGIPTFFVGDEMFFGKDRLGQVEAELSRS
ncbi:MULTISPECIES: 2-hydroxychromene-2-carboxylate isomerase [Caulobacter]|jgi:2-hydroxychromene-2-carboxylate isomerase|uniref:2-hydroxychromene-2-carboxylate isomerase n=1 Tax=Caulobacter vibrioides OR37 TaxID=1292034 RepID=R0E5D5_CAUVI|nr:MULTISPECIES: 2-hydroxychromene-2-carboxylate isomerase [Caulobacter]ENZ80773.1 2-hydroxychromene-2-carboxylate isomerase [Caulobacter vibrioides OR37]MBQ1562289.1 2-hydroxychromene-2-carboxylate isomerase [Caulobacter sp.]